MNVFETMVSQELQTIIIITYKEVEAKNISKTFFSNMMYFVLFSFACWMNEKNVEE